jgi:hypothetical protein
MSLSTATTIRMADQLAVDVRALGGLRTDIRPPQPLALGPSLIV